MKLTMSLLICLFLSPGERIAGEFSSCEVISAKTDQLCQDVHGNSGCRELLHIEALLNGEHLFLVSDTNWRRKIGFDLLPLGSYKIRLLKTEAPAAYMRHSQYQIQYADGKTEVFELEGLSVNK